MNFCVIGIAREGVVSRYAAFDTMPIRPRFWVIRRDPSRVGTSLTCWVTARSMMFVFFEIE